jgi:hypothetical protein
VPASRFNGGHDKDKYGKHHQPLRDGLVAGFVAAVTSGAPSAIWALWTDGDVLEATRAAGAMLIPADSSVLSLIIAAAIVHMSVSLF